MVRKIHQKAIVVQGILFIFVSRDGCCDFWLKAGRTIEHEISFCDMSP